MQTLSCLGLQEILWKREREKEMVREIEREEIPDVIPWESEWWPDDH